MVICYFVGAGPGELELLTLKAKKILEKADYVLYDQLIPSLALEYCPSNCKKISVSKLSPVKTKQSTINEKILEAFLNLTKQKKEGIIVRLKGGDPSIFGRIKEEIEFVKEKKIPFEIIPGISSFYTAAMYAGIPLTARGISGNFSVLTGHFENPEKQIKIIKASDTTVYLMGIKNLAKIIELNLAGGKSPKTPVAIIEKGTMSEQRVITGTLANITAKAQKGKVAHPGIIIIGEVVNLRKKLSWYEEKKTLP